MKPESEPQVADDEIAEFGRLQRRLPGLWKAIHDTPVFEHTSVVVPSLSVDQDELAKIEGAPHYEERLLFSLMRLRHPAARVVYLTSQPVHADIVDYYLQLLHGVPTHLARGRVEMLCAWDGSARPLTEKILERPLLLQRIRRLMGPPERAYLTCFNTTALERKLALRLGIPLNGVDPALLDLGSKSGARRIFAAADVAHPAGFEDLRRRDEIVEALLRLARQRPGLRRAVLKLDQSFSGEGNAIFTYPDLPPSDDPAAAAAIEEALPQLNWSAPNESLPHFLKKLCEMGGVVEECLEDEEIRSPSVQMRIHPPGAVQLVSTHDQILGGPTGQVYLGCRFPADGAYRAQIAEAAGKVALVLRDRGVIGRFGVDFVATRRAGQAWDCQAIEINLRMGGTTPPFLALQFLTGGRLDPAGQFLSPNGKVKFYRATDHLKSAHYRGLLPEDLIEQTLHHGLGYDASTQTGVLFHMIGALSQYGKIGLTCIADDHDAAEALFRRAVRVLDHVAGVTTEGHRHAPLLDLPWIEME